MASATPEQLEASFREAEANGCVGPGAIRRRLIPDSELDVFTEVRFPSREWVLLVGSDERTEDQDIILTTGLTCRTKNGSVEVIAESGTDRLLFCTLLADIVKQLETSTRTPVSALAHRIRAWRRMLGRGLHTGLTPEQRLGLYGELVVLREVLLPTLGEAAVRAWVGPSGGAKDFVLPPVAIEVKTVSSREPERCRISHERQLDSTGLTDLFLVHQVVGTSSDGVLLEELVDDLRCAPEVRAELPHFENCLLQAGWLDVHRSQYAGDRYALVRRRCFSVTDTFPRVTPADLPPAVSGVSYLVSLAVCGSHQVDEETVRAVVARTNQAKE
ncbi:PD-(D/E)XK motif protein [Thermobifida halotolerans]|uniref:PD-(D/E)XK motif protein n=1 Tax=Thermobifida halotolerans TaxID=483545 RepID=A0A399FWV9_9ACTN|nr:PD-(D/E)XK motif protein [Thermobifida halotolerans]UOE18853.1 PD-(D/E)XK motif protein [Thermobifida halotolerans]